MKKPKLLIISINKEVEPAILEDLKKGYLVATKFVDKRDYDSAIIMTHQYHPDIILIDGMLGKYGMAAINSKRPINSRLIVPKYKTTEDGEAIWSGTYERIVRIDIIKEPWIASDDHDQLSFYVDYGQPVVLDEWQEQAKEESIEVVPGKSE